MNRVQVHAFLCETPYYTLLATFLAMPSVMLISAQWRNLGFSPETAGLIILVIVVTVFSLFFISVGSLVLLAVIPSSFYEVKGRKESQ